MIQPTRRRFLHGLSWLAAALARAPRALADEQAPRSLAFAHTHTGECLSTVYFADGIYVPTALDSINHLLRDFRTETVYPIEPQLLDRLYTLQAALGTDTAFQVICGYRSPQTNALLRQRSSGVAEHSLHMQGRAIDIRLPGVDTGQLALLARRVLAGGVGYYQVSDFVHVDTGAVRNWGDPIGAAT
jgi:uncharacterized protein YcbK (DUF882 family)